MNKWINQTFVEPVQKYWFLFQELVKRDFKKKYKGTVLGMLWTILSPLLHLWIMSLVYTRFFGRDTPHYTIYLFSGLLVFSFFKESTNGGMKSVVSNAGIIGKVQVPKKIFLLSGNVAAMFSFLITIVIYFVFAAADGIVFSPRMLSLLYPTLVLVFFNIGMGMLLAPLYVICKDVGYIYDLFTIALRYLSAIFYRVDKFDPQFQNLFFLNPVYCFITYYRMVMIDGVIPNLEYHLWITGYALIVFVIGTLVYRKLSDKFYYYL